MQIISEKGAIIASKVSDLMSNRAASIEGKKSVSAAAKKMAELNVGCLLVTVKGRVVGIVTERDLLKKVLAKRGGAGRTKIKEIMSNPVISPPLYRNRGGRYADG